MRNYFFATALCGAFLAFDAFAADSYLKSIVPIQKRATAKYAEACALTEIDGSPVKFFQVTKDSRKIDLKALGVTHFLVKVEGGSYSAFRFACDGIKNGKRTWVRPQNGEGYAFVDLDDYKGFDQLLAVGSDTFDIWAGDLETLKQVWSQYLKAGYDVANKSWIPTLEKAGFSDAEQFSEISAFYGESLPVDPQIAAKKYAEKCQIKALRTQALQKANSVSDWSQVDAVRLLHLRDLKLMQLQGQVSLFDQADMILALDDLELKFPERGLKKAFERTVSSVDAQKKRVLALINSADVTAEKEAEKFVADCRKAMLANPLLDDVELVAVSRGIGYLNLHDHAGALNYPGRASRREEGARLGVPNLSTHTILTNIGRPMAGGWNSEIVKISNLRGDVDVSSIYKAPDPQLLIGNSRLHWDGNRFAFNMGSNKTPMALHELDISTGKTKQISPKGKDHHVDSCYLPDGNIITMSTAIMTSLPCENGSHLLSNMYLLNPETGKMRQLGVDQENSYHAFVQQDGRVGYIRYEYTDSAHYFNRVLMNMNPDGSNQREIYGSNSVWPTSLFYPHQIPGKPNLYSAVVSGHHGSSHMGRLVLFDMQKGRREAEGAVQFIGAKDDEVEALMVDKLYDTYYPKMMYSTPLDADYYLTMMKPSKFAAWGLYLIDSFDNKTLIYEPKNEFIAWPQILKEREVPPVIPSRIDETSKTSTLYIQDIYAGPGLEGIKRGTVKELVIFAFHYGFQKAASHKYVGIESGWDTRYMLGTVPVNEDGSAMFKVPAMMPITMMAMDENGQAIQKMRTWMNPQPGEVLSCVGCHETADQPPLARRNIAMGKAPDEIKPWYGPARPYSYLIEVQPVLDEYCISCHGAGKKIDLTNSFSENEMKSSKNFSRSYEILQRYVRRFGPESNSEMMVPMEWHASSSQLIQMLAKGHHGVELDKEAWDRLNMWIDLNAPFHAAFFPAKYGPYGDQTKWRADALKKYANLDWNPEAEYQELLKEHLAKPAVKSVMPKKESMKKAADSAQIKVQDLSLPLERMSISFGEPGRRVKSYNRGRAIMKTLKGRETIDFVKIPAGEYLMGETAETQRRVTIEKPFWMSVSEISNSQMQAFEPMFDSKFADTPEKDQTERGYPLYEENKPAVRVSLAKAQEFCKWLSQESGHNVKIPTEAQWEWAARAGTETATWYGDKSADYSQFANLSDRAHGTDGLISRRGSNKHFLFDSNVNDGKAATAPVKSFKPNPWGLFDMIGNAEEWTSTTDENGNSIVKGGSWFDRGQDVSSSARWGYNPEIRLPDLGFRVIIED